MSKGRTVGSVLLKSPFAVMRGKFYGVPDSFQNIIPPRTGLNH